MVKIRSQKSEVRREKREARIKALHPAARFSLLTSLFSLLTPALRAQQPATQPLYSVNAKATQGVGPGNWTYGAVVPLYVSPTGSDTTGNGTQGNPYATIPRALQDVPVFVSQDYVVHLAAGTYYGEVDVTGRYFGTVGTSLYKAAITFQGSTAAIPAAPALSSVASGSLAGATYYVKITYTNPAGETDASTESNLAVASSHVVQVTSPSASGDATGYNVYVSTATGTETKQNASPIAIGTNWTEPTTGLISGSAMPVANTMGDAYVISGATSGAPTTPSANEAVNCTNANCILQGVSVQYGVLAGFYVLGGNAVTYNSTYRHATNSSAFGGNAGNAVLVRNFGTLEFAGDTVISDSITGIDVEAEGQIEAEVTGFDLFGTGWPVGNIVSITTKTGTNPSFGIQIWDHSYANMSGTVTVTGDNTAGQIGIQAHESLAVFQYLNVSTVPIAVRSEASSEVYADSSAFTNCATGWSVRDFSVGDMYQTDSTFTGVTTPYDIADGGWVVRGSANGGATKNLFDGDLETPSGVSINLLPGAGGRVRTANAATGGTGTVNEVLRLFNTYNASASNDVGFTFTNSAAADPLTDTAEAWSVSSLVAGAPTFFHIQLKDGANALKEVLRIKSNGNIGIGDTNPAQAFSVFGKFLVNSSGVATNYNGVALGGIGQPYMPSGGVVDLTAQTGSVTATNLFTPSANGLFRVSYYLTTTTAGSAGTVSVTFTWTDEAKAETFTSTALSLSALGALALQQPLVIYAKTTAAIQYSTTVSGATGSPQYSLHIRIEAL